MQGSVSFRVGTRRSSFSGHQVCLSSCKRIIPNKRQRGRLLIRNAISRTKKEEIVAQLKQNLDESLVVFGITYKGLTTKQLEELRQKMPEGCTVQVAKNTLMMRAIDEVEKDYSELKSACVRESAWIFMSEDGFKDGSKAFLEYEKAALDAQPDPPKGQPKPPPPTEIKGCVMEGKVLDYEAFKKLSKAPGKKELYAKIAGMVKQMPTKVALSVKAVPNKTGRAFGELGRGLPRKLASAIKQVSELNDDKSMTVEDALKAKNSS